METNRRNFLKLSGVALASLPFFGALKTAQAADELPPVKESDAMAKSLSYCENADKLKSKQCAPRKAKIKDLKDGETPMEKRYCYNCQLFTKKSGEGKTAKGVCMLMPKNSVPGNAWCKSWVLKPGV